MARNLVVLETVHGAPTTSSSGPVVGGTTEHALVTEHPVNIFDSSGILLETIAVHSRACPSPATTSNPRFSRRISGSSIPAFRSNLGLRAEQQEVTDAFRLGPRAGLVITPFANGRTIIRAGTGIFYDRVPLNVYGFAFYPDQIITTYNPGWHDRSAARSVTSI